MSYELVFVQQNEECPTLQDLVDYFRRRDWYEVDAGDARYLNSDTGIYFTFVWPNGGEADAEVDEVQFELALARPRVFAEEAAAEIEPFVEAFGFEVRSADEEGEPSAYDPESFVDDWEEANRAALQTIADESDEAPFKFSLPSEKLRRVWEWNRRRRDYQRQLGQSVFVPQMMMFEVGDELQSAVVWPDAVPLALPPVDFVLVSMPEQFSETDEKPTPRRVGRQAFLEAVEIDAEERSEPLEHHLLLWEKQPAELVERLLEEGTVATPSSMTGVPLDVILDEDLLPEAAE